MGQGDGYPSLGEGRWEAQSRKMKLGAREGALLHLTGNAGAGPCSRNMPLKPESQTQCGCLQGCATGMPAGLCHMDALRAVPQKRGWW